MPKQNQSETLSLPQLLQLAGIGGQPQQDTTREALGYMMGQQRLASEDADRKVRQLQNEQENAYRMKALEQQSANADATGLFHACSSEMDPTRRGLLFEAISEKYPSIGKALASQKAAHASEVAAAQALADKLNPKKTVVQPLPVLGDRPLVSGFNPAYLSELAQEGYAGLSPDVALQSMQDNTTLALQANAVTLADQQQQAAIVKQAQDMLVAQQLEQARLKMAEAEARNAARANQSQGVVGAGPTPSFWRGFRGSSGM